MPRIPNTLRLVGTVLLVGASVSASSEGWAESSRKKPEPAQKAEPAKKSDRSDKPDKADKSSNAGKKEATDDFDSEPRPLRDDLPTLEDASVGPRQGSGQRSVSAVKSATEADKPEVDDASSGKGPSGARPAHQKGPVPRKPSPVLPAGVTQPAPDVAGRREIAGGSTQDDLRLGTDDPELRALREAERVLFPKPLDGVEAGWSWELPQADATKQNRVLASGLPPDAALRDAPGPSLSPAESAWLQSLAMPNLPLRLDDHVVKYLLFYRDNARGKAIAKVWAKKSGRYVAAMRAEFAKAGLPSDLVWMSLIESGHSATIYSPVGAAGIWQFMPDAGRLYGLTVDRWVDERLDPQRSTEAAIRYLSDLHRRFGNWELAMAAYNMGYGGLARAVRKFNTNDFWQLVRYEAGIPWETTLYVPKILATAILMNNKKAFGIADVAPEPAVRFDSVRVEPGLSLLDVARAAGVVQAKIEGLNPQFKSARTPPARPGETVQSWLVRVPLGKGVLVSQELAKSNADEQFEPYVVRFGDTLASIAARYRTSEDKLRQINRIGKDELLTPGTVVLTAQLPAGELPGSAQGDEVVVVPPRQFSYPERRRVFYRVLPGDTLMRVAQALEVTRAELLSWNALDTSARLQANMVLQAFVPKDAALDAVRHLEEAQTRVLVAGSDAFFDYFEALNGRKRISVTVKEGETLLSVGKHFGLSVGMMERINRRSRSDKLHAGDSLIVYTGRAPLGARVAGTDDPNAVPLGPINPPRPDALPGSGAEISSDEAASLPKAPEPALSVTQ